MTLSSRSISPSTPPSVCSTHPLSFATSPITILWVSCHSENLSLFSPPVTPTCCAVCAGIRVDRAGSAASQVQEVEDRPVQDGTVHSRDHLAPLCHPLPCPTHPPVSNPNSDASLRKKNAPETPTFRSHTHSLSLPVRPVTHAVPCCPVESVCGTPLL